MIVVSDTSPVTALLTVRRVDLLARRFGEGKCPIARAVSRRPKPF